MRVFDGIEEDESGGSQHVRERCVWEGGDFEDRALVFSGLCQVEELSLVHMFGGDGAGTQELDEFLESGVVVGVLVDPCSCDGSSCCSDCLEGGVDAVDDFVALHGFWNGVPLE